MKTIFIVAILLVSTFCYGQVETRSRTVFYAGFGAGLDYGGIGLKAEYLPVKSISIFAGAGANFDKIGYNGGLSWKILSDKKSTPVLIAMYGYNAVIKVKSQVGNNAIFSKTYFGPSVGAGYDIGVGKKRNKISLSLLVPFRNSAFQEKYDALKAAGYKFNPGISPVAISVGFNIGSSDSLK